jgi:DNA-binding PadR family transcriptional regulator
VSPITEQAVKQGPREPRNPWQVDETYVKVAGQWRYVYRAIDQFGQVIDVFVSPRRDSAIYREVKRLAAMELVTAKREYVGKRPRTVYSITDAGRQVLREWLDTPVSPFAMDFEAMIRLFIAPLGTKEQILATLQQVRDDAQEMLAFGGAVKQEFLDGRAVLQDQVHIRALAVDFIISLLTTVDGWAERTLAEIEGWEDLSPDGKNDRGLEIFARLPVATPGEPTDRTPLPPRTQRRRRFSGSSSTH